MRFLCAERVFLVFLVTNMDRKKQQNVAQTPGINGPVQRDRDCAEDGETCDRDASGRSHAVQAFLILSKIIKRRFEIGPA